MSYAIPDSDILIFYTMRKNASLSLKQGETSAMRYFHSITHNLFEKPLS